MARLDRKARRALQPRHRAKINAHEETSANTVETTANLDTESQNQESTSSESSTEISSVPSPLRSRFLSGHGGEATSYREKLRASGQQALRRVQNGGLQRHGARHEQPMQATGGDRHFAAYTSLHAAPHLAPGDWRPVSLTPPPSPMPMPHSPPASPVRLSASAAVWTPATLGCGHMQEPMPGFGFEEMPEAGLMAIAMPQAMSWALDYEQIAAELRAAAPCLYED